MVAIQERRDIELLRRLEDEIGLLAAFLGDFWCPPVAEQFQQIAGCAYQLLLRADLVVAAQAEAPKTSSLPNLTEYRFSVAATTQPESTTVRINGSGHGGESDRSSPGPSIEQIIATAWAEVLVMSSVDPEANLFPFGGLSERHEQEEQTGKKACGRHPKVPVSEEAMHEPTDQCHSTDSESRITPDGAKKASFLQGYNKQAAVDAKTRVQRFTQASRRRPGPRTAYIRHSHQHPVLHWHSDAQALPQEARTDGVFPLISNDETLTLKDAL